MCHVGEPANLMPHLLSPQLERLRGSHRHVEEEQVVGRQERREGCPHGVGQRSDMRQPCAGEQVGGGLRAHVQVVAHGDALRGDGENVELAGRAEDLVHRGPGDLGQEPQPLDGGIGVPAEPRHLAGPLVDRRVRPGTAFPVLHDEHRLRRADRAGHRYHRVVVVGGVEDDIATLEQTLGLLDVGCPALGDDGGPHRAAQRVAVLGVGEGRTTVQDRAALHARHRLTDGGDRHELGHALVEPAHHLGVRLVDRGRGVAVQAAERPHGRPVAASGDPPVHVLDGTSLAAYRVGEHR
jgi:hypothetical protein